MFLQLTSTFGFVNKNSTISVTNKEPVIIQTIPTLFVNERKMKIDEVTGIPTEKQQLASHKALNRMNLIFLKDDVLLLIYSNSNEFYVNPLLL